MDSSKATGIALRSQVVSPREIVKLAKVIDQSPVTHLFIPDINFDSLEISAACLGVSKGLKVGSGVFRPLEWEVHQLTRRLETLQAFSDSRYLLGIGTGNPGPDPKQKIQDLLGRLDELRKEFDAGSFTFPESYVAALRAGMAKRAAGRSDGILLNFCPSEHAKAVVESVRKSFNGKIETACYLKAFFSKSLEIAKKLAIEEFVKYDNLGHYHKMFELSGLEDDIRAAARSLQGKDLQYSEKLAQTSPVNPDIDELREYVSKFREAGISLPSVYPYFDLDESFEFKLNTIHAIISATA
ncbi:MAG TPA: LLM class flavin-dependent oxidoreductase [Nitrososphaerales archaeon]|nr:LLM class flavin-dependent oxidoreductase [Nitrososphaerales archaeon]